MRLLRYAIKAIRVLASSAKAIVQDCVEAEDNTDARDKFFMSVVVVSVQAMHSQWRLSQFW